jgi:hypothetical protein
MELEKQSDRILQKEEITNITNMRDRGRERRMKEGKREGEEKNE